MIQTLKILTQKLMIEGVTSGKYQLYISVLYIKAWNKVYNWMHMDTLTLKSYQPIK